MEYWKQGAAPVKGSAEFLKKAAAAKAATRKISEPVTKAVEKPPVTVQDVISARRVDAEDVVHREGGLAVNVRVGEIPAPTQRQIREAHRNAAGDGEISDREPLTVLDVLRAASANDRVA